MPSFRSVVADALPAPERELDMMFRRQPASVAATIFLAIVATSILWETVEQPTLLAWLAVVGLVSAWRYGSARRYLGLAMQDVRLWRWDRLLTAGAVASAACWGALPWLIPDGDHAAMQFAAFILAGVTAFATVALFSSTRAVSLFLLAVLLPLAARLFAMDDKVYWGTALAVLLYMGMMLSIALHLRKIIRKAFHLDAHNTELAGALERLKVLDRESAIFRNMVEMAGDMPVMLHDPRDGYRVKYANDAACRHFGIERSTLLTWHPAEWDVELDAARLEEVKRQIERTGGAAFETRHRRISGEIVPVSVLVSEFDYAGERYSVSIVHDLRAGRQSVHERQELESLRYLSCFEASIPGFLFTCRRHGRRYTMPYVSSAVYEVHGVKASQVYADAGMLWQFVHNDDRPVLLNAFEHSSNTLEMLETDYRILHPENGERWVHVRAVPQLEDDGSSTVWHGFMYDATETKLFEARERQRQAEFRTLVESSPDVVVRYDGELRRTYVNTAWERVNGLTSAEVLGKRPSELAGAVAPFAPEYEAKLRAVLDSGKHGNIDLSWRDESGELVCFDMRVVPEFGMDGKASGLLTVARDVSARKRAEEQLRRHELEYRSLAENSPDPIYRYDRDCRRIYLNQSVERLTGRSREELLGRSPLEFMPTPAVDAVKAQQCIQSVLNSGEPRELEVTFVAAHGQEVSIHNVFVPEFADDGSVRSVLCIGRDITERKRMEQELSKNRSRLQSMMRTIPDMIWMKDAYGMYLSCNHAFEILTGKKESAIIGGTDFDLFDSGLANFFRQKDREAVEAGQVCVNEEWVTYAGSGKRALLETRKVPVLDENGKVSGVLGVARDITERKRMENVLAAREQEFRSLAENSPDVIMRYDHECRRVYVNPVFLQLVGRSQADMLGRKPTDYSSAQGAFDYENALRRALGSGEEVEHEYAWPARDGSMIVSQFRIVPERDRDGRVTSVLAIGRDITERKHMEDELAKREHEFRMLVENTPDTISRYDGDCRRIYANPALQASSGPRADMLSGTRPSQFPGGELAEGYEARLREVLATGVAADFELDWCGTDGRRVHSLIRMTPEYDVGGEVVSVLAVGRDITEMVEYREKIHDLAFYDTVTGLANRSLFNDRLSQALADAYWHEALLGVMVLDLDRFKAVNDTLGHHVGDMLLREVAGRLSLCVRGYDTVARLGGDEFAVLLPEIRDAQNLGSIAEKILQALAEPVVLDGKDVFVGSSLGIAIYPGDSADAQSLLKYADLAMYSAKQDGGNCFRYYSEELTSRAQERMQLETELRRALERGEFELYYQPKVDVADGSTIGSEALLRWNSAKFGMVAPDRFIGIAEDTGMIVKIGEWVLYEACRTACAWNAPGMPRHKVAVNLSSRQFYGGDLLAMIAGAMQETGCRAEWIELEITESLLLDNAMHVRVILESLRSMGFTIAIDDFGTGYSALSYLTNFPIDVLKIDRSFVRDMLVHPNKAELVKAIITMVDCLKLGLVAEGVETQEQAAFLLQHGCRTAQGYLYGKPVKREEFEALQPGSEAI